MQLSGTMTTNKDHCMAQVHHQLANIEDTLIAMSQQVKEGERKKETSKEPAERQGGTLHSGKQYLPLRNSEDSDNDQGQEEQDLMEVGMCPVMSTPTGQQQYGQWSLMIGVTN